MSAIFYAVEIDRSCQNEGYNSSEYGKYQSCCGIHMSFRHGSWKNKWQQKPVPSVPLYIVLEIVAPETARPLRPWRIHWIDLYQSVGKRQWIPPADFCCAKRRCDTVLVSFLTPSPENMSPVKRHHVKRKIIFQPSIFKGYLGVVFRGGKSWKEMILETHYDIILSIFCPRPHTRSCWSLPSPRSWKSPRKQHQQSSNYFP